MMFIKKTKPNLQ